MLNGVSSRLCLFASPCSSLRAGISQFGLWVTGSGNAHRIVKAASITAAAVQTTKCNRPFSPFDLRPSIRRSPERHKDLDSSSPPIVRHVRDILGENTIPLRISEPPKPGGRTADGSAHTQRTASSSSLRSNNGNQVEAKVETSRSLIDFDADPEPSIAAAVPQAQQSTTVQPTTQPENSANDNNWASFDVVA